MNRPFMTGRIRSISPAFCRSLKIGRVSREARLTFLCLLTIADDEGRCIGHEQGLKSLLYPFDDHSAIDMAGHLGELASQGLIDLYQVQGESFLVLAGWTDHQRIEKPTPSRLPGPEDADFDTPPAGQKVNLPPHRGKNSILPPVISGENSTSASDRRLIGDDSTNDRRLIDDQSARDGMGWDGMGWDTGGLGGETGIPVPPLSAKADDLDQAFAKLQELWNQIPGLAKCHKLTSKRRASFRKRYQTAGWRADAARALDRIRSSPFLSGGSKAGWRANLDWFLRPDTVLKILEGTYDDSNGQLPLEDRARAAKARRNETAKLLAELDIPPEERATESLAAGLAEKLRLK